MGARRRGVVPTRHPSPSLLQAEAEKPDDEPFPLTRWIATHTPPIPGYEERVMGQELESQQTELARFFEGNKRRK